MSDTKELGLVYFPTPEEAIAFDESLPEGERLVRNPRLQTGWYKHLQELNRAKAEPEPFKDDPPSDGDFAKLCQNRDAAKQVWEALEIESAAIPTLLTNAIGTDDFEEMERLKSRRAALPLELILSELRYQQARARTYYAEKARAIAERDKRRDRMSELGKAFNYPKGKEAFDKAEKAYFQVRDVSNPFGLSDANARIAALRQKLEKE